MIAFKTGPMWPDGKLTESAKRKNNIFPGYEIL